ncbi:hypothetical protein [Cyclobacterium sp. SYSU L10401]|uniref:hypothetical protein n=1 Tax=Cyclobacterium sp. SYSU L10401 TaxID=2678657 RepID=UPI0013D69233|nr:hypothetical protein [Cyclobacterium sp. SYSU L10401]
MNSLTVSSIKPAIIVERGVEILKLYPIQTIHGKDGEMPKMGLKKSLNPEIIITESFSK